MKTIFFSKLWIILIIILLGVLFTTYLIDKTLVSDELFQQSFGSQLSEKQMQHVLANRAKNLFFYDIWNALVFMLKMLGIAGVIGLGVYLNDYKIKFNQVLSSVFVSAAWFILTDFIKWLWFFFVTPPLSMKELTFFMPLSVLTIFDTENLSFWQIELFKNINIFEVLFIFSIAYGLNTFAIKKSFKEMVILVLSTYGISFVIIVGIKIWIFLYAGGQ
ncbi:MAG: hypothetical protein U0Y10_06865 [Spirosomataceae bacterium]